VRVLVTGSAGFIGTHLCQALQDNHEVTGVDRADGDLLEHGVYARHLDRVKPDVVIHLAAQVGRLFGEDDVRNAVRSNVELSTLIAHETAGKARVVFSSSSEVYGDRGDLVCREDDPLDVLPHNIYGVTKRQAEEAFGLYMPPEDLTIVRLSMPYGPGAPPGRGRRAMDTMLWQAHHRLPITVHRGAERSWCWVGDTVAGIVTLIEGAHAGVFNVGRDDDPRSMLWLAERACEMTDAPKGLISVVDAPSRQTVVKRLSTDKLRSLGWEPTVEIDEGMREVYRWVANFGPNGERFGLAA
jgi:nucleoside-diphosphate-sugar epimerase